MAGSRLEKIGTIFTRVSGLLQSRALTWEDRPLWYDIYNAFPPFDIPKYDRTAPNGKLKQLFYKEDKERAIIHKNNKDIGAIDFLNNNYKPLVHRFAEKYENHYQSKNLKGSGIKEELKYSSNLNSTEL